MQPKIIIVENHSDTFLSHRMFLAEQASRAGFEVHIATPPFRNDVSALLQNMHHHVIPITRRDMGPREESRSVEALIKLYRRVQPDLVHHLRMKPMIYGGVAARYTGVKAVVNAMTGRGYLFLKRSFKELMFRRFVIAGLRFAFGHKNQVAIFQNHDDQAFCIDLGICRREESIVIKGAGVSLSAYFPVPEPGGVPLVVLASRMLWDKGVGVFVAAAAALRAQGVSARFVLCGATDEGNPTTIPSRQLRQWHDSGVIEWWGFVPDMQHVFSQAHVVCLPSFAEGMARVLVEAAAAGKPIVTSDAPGCREIVHHGENGFLVPVKDSAALARALQTLIADGELRRKFGAQGRLLAEAEFSQEQVAAETIAVYCKLLGLPARPPVPGR